MVQSLSDLFSYQAGYLSRNHKEDGIYTVQGCFQIGRSGNLITNNDIFKIALIGMIGVNFIDLFLDISPETDFMAVIIEDL